MTEELKSEGKCLYCGKMFSQKEIGKHLAEHLTIMEKQSAGKTVSNYVHVEVEAGEMFLHLLVKGDAQMKVIDMFLRDIWLECCGHLSAFGHKNFKVGMSHRVEDVFQPRIKIYHDYDFGTTTRVFLKAHKHYQLNLKEKIILLSRNEPLKIMCSMCKKEPAVNICTACWYEKEAFFCEVCSEKHAEECEDFNDYAQMPVVNLILPEWASVVTKAELLIWKEINLTETEIMLYELPKSQKKIARQIIKMALQRKYQNGLEKMDAIIFGERNQILIEVI